MKFTVEMTPTAERELARAFRYIHDRAPQNAIRWLNDINRSLASLETFPNRCRVAPESEPLGETIRHLVFKSHRIVFFVDKPVRIVRVLYIRHSKMRAASTGS